MCLFKEQGFALQLGHGYVRSQNHQKATTWCSLSFSHLVIVFLFQPFRRRKMSFPMAVSKKLHWAYLDRNSRIKAVVFFKQWQDNAEVPCHRKDLRVERDLGFARDKLSFITPSHPSPSHHPLFLLLCFPLVLCFLIHSFLLQTCISPMFQSLMKRGARSCLHIRLHVGNTWIERERIRRLQSSDSQLQVQLESRGNLKKKKTVLGMHPKQIRISGERRLGFSGFRTTPFNGEWERNEEFKKQVQRAFRCF